MQMQVTRNTLHSKLRNIITLESFVSEMINNNGHEPEG